MLGLLKSIFSFHLLFLIIYPSCLSCHHHSLKIHSLIYFSPRGVEHVWVYLKMRNGCLHAHVWIWIRAAEKTFLYMHFYFFLNVTISLYVSLHSCSPKFIFYYMFLQKEYISRTSRWILHATKGTDDKVLTCQVFFLQTGRSWVIKWFLGSLTMALFSFISPVWQRHGNECRKDIHLLKNLNSTCVFLAKHPEGNEKKNP